MADNRTDEPVIGVAFDGTGYGTDGTIWGGEFLLADLTGFRRAAHLAPIPMPGGAAAIKQPWRMAASYLDSVFADSTPELEVFRRNEKQWQKVVELARAGVNSPVTSSAGRLFDAVAALLGVRDAVNYEGQAAIELEQLTDRAEAGRYPVSDGLTVPGPEIVRAVAEELVAGVPVPVIAGRFHNTMAGVTVSTCRALRESSGRNTVALSGGVFQNLLLLHRIVAALREDGFTVLTHSRVPCNDGGISLGQAAVAGALDRQTLCG
jgi:hydrogenase maturation protein HypF